MLTLLGCGINTRAATIRPNGDKAWQVNEDVWLVETGAGYIAEAPGLRLDLDADELVGAAGQLRNYVTAAVHNAQQDRLGDPTYEALVFMALRTLAGAA